jgi:hypothetical protein
MLPCCGAANVEAAMKLLAIIALGTVLAATVAQRLSDQIVGGLANAETIQAAKRQACQDVAAAGDRVVEGSGVRGD